MLWTPPLTPASLGVELLLVSLACLANPSGQRTNGRQPHEDHHRQYRTLIHVFLLTVFARAVAGHRDGDRAPRPLNQNIPCFTLVISSMMRSRFPAASAA